MQKVTKFLEEYVQWVALGLAVLWMAWIGYAYWIKEPVTAPVAGQPRAPGDVDDAVAAREGPIGKLDQALKNEVRIPPNVLAMLNPEKKPEYVGDFQREMGLEDYAPILVPPTSPPGTKVVVGPETTQPTAPEQKATLPVLAADTIVPAGITTGMSVVWKPDPAVKLNPNDQTQKVIQFNQDGPNAAQPLPVAAVPKEVAWLIFEAKLDLTKLAAAFQQANVPVANANTEFLRVELVRQEQQADSSWGQETVIEPLKNVQMQPYPPKQGQEEATYVDWASRHTADIAQPVFYEYLRGDPWRIASMPDQDALMAAQQNGAAFDPALVKPGEISKLTPEQLKIWRDWKAQKDKEEQDRRKSEADSRKAQQAPKGGEGRGGGGGGAPRGLGGGRYAPFDFTQKIIPPNASGPVYRGSHGGGRGYPPPGRIPPDGNRPRGPYTPEGTRPYAPEGAAQQQIPNFTPQEPLPQGPFNPFQIQPQAPVEIWAHDETTQPGHRYRYKLRVSFQNPLYGAVNMAKNAADEQVLAIVTETPWSEPIMAPTKDAFFVQNGGPGTLGGEPKINVEYIYWEDGDWKSKTLTLHPGDQIGKTPWTLVDVRPNASGGENKAVVMNETSGQVEDRYYKKDLASAEYKRLKKLVPAATPVNPAGGPASAVGFNGGPG
jgi:hypothetical protein